MAVLLDNMGETHVFQGLGVQQVGDYTKKLIAWNHIMNALVDLSMKNDEVLRVELEVFRREHSDLDDAICALQEQAGDLKKLFAVHDAEGQQLALVANRKMALALAVQNDYAPQPLH